MRTINGDQTLLRIFIGGSDTHGGRALYTVLVELFRKEGLAGATVTRGLLGYGASSRLHTSRLLRLSQDLPVIVEAVDTRERIERVLPLVEETIGDGDCLITLEKVEVFRYGREKNGKPE